MAQTSATDLIFEKRAKQNSVAFSLFTFFLSLSFFAAVPLALAFTGESYEELWQSLQRILSSPSKLVTDYFYLGSLAGAFFNAGVCGTACNLMIFFSGTKKNATTFAAYVLVIAHCFYGLNFINMWPPFIGVIVYCIVKRQPFGKNLHIAMFSTALAPFISDFLFCHPLGKYFPIGVAGVGVTGILLSVLFGVASGFLVPALLPGTTAMHRGYNMYKAGLALGMLGIFVYCFLYRTLGISPAEVILPNNETYAAFGYSYTLFVNLFFFAVFSISLLLGFCCNGFRFRGYGQLLGCTGHGMDFADRFGMPLCLINFGVYGFCILIYLNLVSLLPALFPFLPQGAAFTGPTVGVMLAALTFSADGQHPRNVAPIALGYSILFAAVCLICVATGMEIPWTLSTQAYINGLAFATGLCPIAGKYGWKIGVVAGLVSAIICTSTSAMHGGFVLYNGGFNAGLAALILIPVLDFYRIEPKFSDDE